MTKIDVTADKTISSTNQIKIRTRMLKKILYHLGDEIFCFIHLSTFVEQYLNLHSLAIFKYHPK
ncbi:hypothetical protein PCC6912_54900 [Chlorogloeopsis fritschii PCC 6912]|uniref:Uncharacterized protein n=1 Tax=Chlorogloeopsis fritschii PCC 6912 TaxID=211165 RepID=A0A3S0XJ57_CHLFR|nr:hypothetical protein PCC6912_54900 [Chlorogloeopsis fritschii PCC 6912]